RLPDQAVPGRSLARDRVPLPGREGSAPHDGRGPAGIAGRRDPRTPQVARADALEHERPHGRVARLFEPDRTRQELGLDRNAVPHLPGARHEDERTLPVRSALLNGKVSPDSHSPGVTLGCFLARRRTPRSPSNDERFPGSAAVSAALSCGRDARATGRRTVHLETVVTVVLASAVSPVAWVRRNTEIAP